MRKKDSSNLYISGCLCEDIGAAGYERDALNNLLTPYNNPLTHITLLLPSGTSGGDGQTYREAAWMDVYSRCPPTVVRPGVVRREAMCYTFNGR